MEKNIDLIKKLRQMTQAPVSDVMNALKASNNDLEKAVQWLREKVYPRQLKK